MLVNISDFKEDFWYNKSYWRVIGKLGRESNASMTKKQIYILSSLGVLVILLIAWGVFWRSTPPVAPGAEGNPSSSGGEQAVSTSTEPGGIVPAYSPNVPANATPSVPKNEAPASANPTLDTKMLFFDLKAAASGFTPSSFTVHKGDSLHISFTAVDGDYDLDFPYLGAYFSTVKKGQTKDIPFDTSISGTFAFECRDACPSSGKIQGKLIVLP